MATGGHLVNETRDELSTDLASVLDALAHAPSWPLAEPVQIAPGERIGRYTLERVIGRGGFGIVFAARDAVLGRAVAIKVTRGAPTPIVLDRFEREARIAASLNHPALVTLHDTGTINGLPYLVMELLDGETLAARCEREAPTLAGAVALIREVAAALGRMHAAGIVHLDLKPSNVFVTREGRVKVLDFGLAELRGDNPAAVGGTRGYMAPEQREGRAVDARSDVYALGIMLLELATGGLRGPGELALAPAELRPLLARALAEPAERRFADGAELHAAILALAEPKRRRRRRIYAAVAVAAIAIAVAVPVTVARRAREETLATATLAEAAGRQAAAIAAELRYAFVKPLHPIARDTARAQLELALLAVQVGGTTDDGGVAQIALARGERTFGDLAGARTRLEAVLARSPSPAALEVWGNVLLDQYEGKLILVAGTTTERIRAVEQVPLVIALREPALRALRQTGATNLLDLARIALAERRNSDAIELARQAIVADPDLLEAASRLAAGYQGRANDERDAGQDEAAARDYRAADAVLEQAILTGRSAWFLYGEACTNRAEQLAFEVHLGTDGAATYEAGHIACDRAYLARPSPRGAMDAVTLEYARATQLLAQGLPADEPLRRGEVVVERALARDPDNFLLLRARGMIAFTRAEAVADSGDPRSALNEARAALEAALAVRPDGNVAPFLAGAESMLAENAIARGEDPRGHVARVLALYPQDPTTLHLDVGRALIARATWEASQATDPTFTLDRAIEALHREQLAHPTGEGGFDEEAGAWQARAAWQRDHGGDEVGSLDRAIECSGKMIAINDTSSARANLALEVALRADAELRRGGDARPWLERSFAELARSRELAPANEAWWINSAMAHEVAVRVALAGHRDAHKDLALARDAIARARSIEPDDPEAAPVACSVANDAIAVAERAGEPTEALRRAACQP